MEPILATLAAGAATRIITALAPRPANAGDFAALLGARIKSLKEADGSARIEEFVDRISELPLTSSQAREVARELQALLAKMEQFNAGAGLAGRINGVLQDFVARISKEFLLSREDSARLADLVYDWAGRQFGEAVGANSIESTA